MKKSDIQAEIEKVKNNKFLPQAVKDIKLKKLNEQLAGAKDEPAPKAEKAPKPQKKDWDFNATGNLAKKVGEDSYYIEANDTGGKITYDLYKNGKVFKNDASVKNLQKLVDTGKASKSKPKKSSSSGVQSLIDELTDIGIDLDGPDETLLAGFRMELEENKNDRDKLEDVIGEFRIGPKIQDEKADKEVDTAIKKYYKKVPEPKGKKSKSKKAKSSKPAKEKVAYQYKGRHIKELTEEDCEELRKDVAARRKNQAKAEKKSKSKPVIEKVAKHVASATKQAIKNVSAADLKKNPTKELNKMAALEQAAKEFLAKVKSIMGSDYDKDAVEGEFKEVHDLIKGIKGKYGK